MSTAITTTNGAESAVDIWSAEEQEVIRSVIAPGLTDPELRLFAHACRNFGLNPLMNQIHAIKRNTWNPDTKRSEPKMTIQTSIHGLRLIADRTKNYAPGRRPTFEYKPDGTLLSATAYVKKFAGGQWHEVEDTAFWDEYVQMKDEYEDNRKTGRKVPSNLWATKPHVMLSKCSEGLALRRAFPAETSGLYADEEMPLLDEPRGHMADTGATITPQPAALLARHEPQPTAASSIRQAPQAERVTERQIKAIYALGRAEGFSDEETNRLAGERYGSRVEMLAVGEASEFIERIKGTPQRQAPEPVDVRAVAQAEAARQATAVRDEETAKRVQTARRSLLAAVKEKNYDGRDLTVTANRQWGYDATTQCAEHELVLLEGIVRDTHHEEQVAGEWRIVPGPAPLGIESLPYGDAENSGSVSPEAATTA